MENISAQNTVIPKCVEDTIPEIVRDELGTPPTKTHLAVGLSGWLDDQRYLAFKSLGSWPHIEANETRIFEHIELLYDFVYFRKCDLSGPLFVGDRADFLLGKSPSSIPAAANGLYWLLQSVRYQTFTKLGSSLYYVDDDHNEVGLFGTTRSAVFEATAHFVQLAFLQMRLEFDHHGIYVPDEGLFERLSRKSNCSAIFTNQEVEFIANVSAQSISNELRDDGMLEKVSSSEVVHWANYSGLPDYLNPRMGNEIGNKQSFITLPSLQSWLARKPHFLPTQFIYKNYIPIYTSNSFFKDCYLAHIESLKISDQELYKEIGVNEVHLKWLKKGTRPLFLRQAFLLDNLIYRKLTGCTELQCFPTYHLDD